MQKVINVFNELPKEVIESQSTQGRSGGRGEDAVAGEEEAGNGAACAAVLFPAHCPRKTGRHGSCPQSVPSNGRSECISQI